MHELAIDGGGFWLSVLQIIAIDILLGGDNAVVIALACRRLPESQRNRGILWGVVGAIALRLILIFFALQLLALPFLKIVGALLLLWIGIKLLQPEDTEAHASIEAPQHLWGAVKTIVIADAVMSLDNVVAVAGAAKGDITLVAFGIVVSIPIIVWGSKLVLLLMDRFPAIITLGGALLGWIAGEMLVTDIMIEPLVHDLPHWVHYLAAAFGALIVVSVGLLLARRRRAPTPALEEVASGSTVAETPPRDTPSTPISDTEQHRSGHDD
jgi:YjbE family integral membrane protein